MAWERIKLPQFEKHGADEDDLSAIYRIDVPGGWLYRYREWNDPNDPGDIQHTSIVFVPGRASD